MARYDFDDTGQPWLDDWQVTQPSTLLAVEVEDVKRRLRLPCDCDDETDFEIEGFIRTNQLWLETLFEVSLLDTTITFTFRGFPLHSRTYTGANLFLPRPPTIIVNKIEFFDEDDAKVALNANQFRVTTRRIDRKSDIQIIDDEGWPTLSSRFDRVFVEVRAGVATADLLDYRIKEWIIRKSTHDFRHGRDAQTDVRLTDVKHAFGEIESLLTQGHYAGNATA